MKKIIRKLIILAMCACTLTTAGCSINAPAQDDFSVSVVISDTEVSAVDVVSDTEAPDTDSSPKPVIIDCAAGLHDMETKGTERKCAACSCEVTLPAEMWSDFITEEYTEIEAGGILFQIDEGVYVPGYFEEVADTLVAALESVSGLSYTDALNSKRQVRVHVAKVEPQEFNGILSDGEVGGAWAASGEDRELEISAGDLFLCNSYTLAHELSHTLCFSQGPKYYCQLLLEGFAEYNCYKTIKYLEENSIETAYTLDHSYSSLFNMDISDPEHIYIRDPEYWFENDFPTAYAMNGPYALGFRFMAYLDDVYGDYSSWMHTANKMDSPDNELPVDMQIESLKQTYGQDVLDGFYPWLKANWQRFVIDHNAPADYDLSQADVVTFYPYFYSWNCDALLADFHSRVFFSDLYIDLEEFKSYLSEYKNRETDRLVLNIEWIEGDRTVELFDSCGNSLGISTGDGTIELDNVSFILLKGDGILRQFAITGFRGYESLSE